MDIGCRVVRGHDWEWGDQDDGEGSLGVVVEVDNDTKGTVWVQWESGRRANYRAGFEDKMDLIVYDSSGAGIVHPHIMCDGCNQEPLVGMRWKCQTCVNFDLCTSCYMADTHGLDCKFQRIDAPHEKGIPVGKREGGVKVSAKGLFSGARVSRGPDWRWGEQDGGQGNLGTVTAVRDWKDNAKKCGVSVKWDRSKSENVYRNGVQGKVDLRVVTPESGGFYYKDHLPGLVARPKKTVSGFTTGDKVHICVSREELVKMAEGHGGWNEGMEKCISKIGVVQDFTKSGDVIVNYDGEKWRFTPTAITKVHKFKTGDKVLVSSDKTFVKEMQNGHGGWNANMKTMLGTIGTVKSVHEDGDVVIAIDNHIWLVSPAILTLHEASKTDDDDDDDENITVDLSNPLAGLLTLKLLSQMLGGGDDDDDDDDKDNTSSQGKAFVQAVGQGHLSHTKQILQANPEVINHTVMGKTGLHLACHNGHGDIIKLLLETPNCDTTIKDSQSFVAIHHAAYGDKTGEAIKLMLAHGADPNTADNPNKCTPLHLAVKESNLNAVRALVEDDKCDINLQDSEGDTPLHEAIHLKRNTIVDTILDGRHLNLTLKNNGGFNALQLAAIKGNLHAVKKLLSKSPELINTAKEDGFTSLHLAALNDHCEIAEALLEQPDCVVDCETKKHQTPLILAVHEGYLAMVKVLVPKGADVNATDEDGDTPLHMSLMKERFTSSGMGQMLRLLGNSTGSYAEVSRYLLSRGADVRKSNRIGKTPMDYGVGTTMEDELKAEYERTKGTDEKDQAKQQTTTKTVNQFGNTPVEPMDTDQQHSTSTAEELHNLSHEMTRSCTTEIHEKTDQNTQLTTEEQSSQMESLEFQNGCGGNDPVGVVQSGLDTKCLICADSDAVVVFHPCGHCVLCKDCSMRANRCPECKQKVETKKTKDGSKLQVTREENASFEEKLQTMEKKLRKLEESVTCCVCMSRRMNMVFSCGHGACQVCTEQLRVCAICQKNIERKIAMF